MNWSVYGDRWKNSVLQLFVVHAKYKPNRPYGDPVDKKSAGSGFIIDIERGYVVTNAHVVSNAISITGRIHRLGKRDLSLELIGICKDKDLALCKIHHDDIDIIVRPYKNSQGNLNIERAKEMNMIFGDNMKINQTDEVMTIGYPLGKENIKYTTGIVSGFESKNERDDEDGPIEDSIQRSPTYIQITAAINPGNSGGPLLNKNGEVIGINAAGYLFAQNVGYAIPSRTFLSIYCNLVKNTIVKMPTLALEWNQTNRELMQLKTEDGRTYGIYVRRVHPDSCVDNLEEGDIIKRLDYEDSFWASQDSFKIENLDPDAICDGGNKVLINCYFDRYGDASVGMKEPKTGKFVKLIERKMSFAEIMDMVPIGSALQMEIYRDRNLYILKTDHNYVESKRIPNVYPRLEPIDYEIFAGLCCSDLNMSHVDYFDNLELYDRVPENRYQRRVVICQVFPDTQASKTKVLKAGYLLESLNGQKVETLEDIRKILRTRPEEISIKTKNRSFFLVSTETVIPEDKRAMKSFNIRGHNYLLDSPQTQ